MSARTKLLMDASQRVGNPFVLCRVLGQRARQLMGSDARWTAGEVMKQALQELAAGALELEMPEEAQ